MAYDEQLARLGERFSKGNTRWQRKMFAGTLKALGRTVGSEPTTDTKEPHRRPMDFTGRPMKGYIFESGRHEDGGAIAEAAYAGAGVRGMLAPCEAKAISSHQDHQPLTKEDLVMTAMASEKNWWRCVQGKNQEAIDRSYSTNIESVEPCAMPGMEQTQRGIAKIKGKINGGWTTTKSMGALPKDRSPMATASSCDSSMTSRQNTRGNA